MPTAAFIRAIDDTGSLTRARYASPDIPKLGRGAERDRSTSLVLGGLEGAPPVLTALGHLPFHDVRAEGSG